jgi:hypothetical protein
MRIDRMDARPAIRDRREETVGRMDYTGDRGVARYVGEGAQGQDTIDRKKEDKVEEKVAG